jgi:hypothetical protein
VFGPDGFWPRFLRQAEGFIATEMNCESRGDGQYRIGELVEKQEFVGAYYEADGDDLVSA